MGRIVFQHVAAHHHDLGPLRDDAECRTHRGIRGLTRHVRATDHISARQAQRERTIVRRVSSHEVREPSQRQGRGSFEDVPPIRPWTITRPLPWAVNSRSHATRSYNPGLGCSCLNLRGRA